MNVQSIWAGEYYAFAEYRPNKSFVVNAQKGKAIKVEKTRQMGNDRKTAYVILELENGYQKTVRARDVIDFWSDYEREREAYYKEAAEKAERERKEREDRMAEQERRLEEQRRLREARERVEQERTTKLVDAFIKKTGLPKEVVQTVGTHTVSLDRMQLEFYLSMPQESGTNA